MPNGRAMPSAMLFDWLLGRAWTMAMTSYASASSFSSLKIGGGNIETGIGLDGAPSIERFLTKYAGNEPAAAVAAHDQALRGQLADVASRWAIEFKGVMDAVAPVGPGFLAAIEWLRRVVNGGEGLGYLGYDHRTAQAAGFANAAVNRIGGDGIYIPPAAAAAQRAIAGQMAALHTGRMAIQMRADHEAERHKLRVDAAEALLRAYNDALDAAMDYLFTEMHLMFDVFGRNNDFLVKLQRQEQAMRARMEIRSAELAGWDERIQSTDDSRQAANQKARAVVERANSIDTMKVDAHIKLLRRYSSRAAAALNASGVSVSSSASESNSISGSN